MEKLKLPNSLRKYIRKEKANIRRNNSELSEQKKLVNELYQRILKREADPTTVAKNIASKGKPKKEKATKKPKAKAKAKK